MVLALVHGSEPPELLGGGSGQRLLSPVAAQGVSGLSHPCCMPTRISTTPLAAPLSLPLHPALVLATACTRPRPSSCTTTTARLAAALLLLLLHGSLATVEPEAASQQVWRLLLSLHRLVLLPAGHILLAFLWLLLPLELWGRHVHCQSSVDSSALAVAQRVAACDVLPACDSTIMSSHAGGFSKPAIPGCLTTCNAVWY